MTTSWRPLTVAVGLMASLGAGAASAQTVIVRHAKPGTSVELVVNTTAAGSATADAVGDATIAGDLKATLGKEETDAYIHVDVCSTLVRVHLVERGVQPPPAGADCTQQQIGGLFWLRHISSLVVDVAGPNMTMRLKQGPAPAAWLVDAPEGGGVRRSASTGLVFYGGGGLSRFADVNVLACGSTACAKRDMGIAYTGGITYWLARFVAVDASYMRPAIATADGGESGYRFNSELHTHLLTLGGYVGVPAGPARIYGRVGTTYHRASLRTTQTIDDSRVTIDGEEQTIEGGTQSYDLRTAGWGWIYGGGVEAWATPRFAVYVEGGFADVKGTHVDAGEGSIDDRVTYVVFGARFRIR